MLQMRCVYVTTVFGYLRHMYLSGLSIVMRLLLPAEILHFEKNFWSKKRQHKANFLYFLFGVTLRISLRISIRNSIRISLRDLPLILLWLKTHQDHLGCAFVHIASCFGSLPSQGASSKPSYSSQREKEVRKLDDLWSSYPRKVILAS